MSDSYAVNERRELILDRVKEFIYQNGGVVKKSQLNELGIDYRKTVIIPCASVIFRRRSSSRGCFRTV